MMIFEHPSTGLRVGVKEIEERIRGESMDGTLCEEVSGRRLETECGQECKVAIAAGQGEDIQSVMVFVGVEWVVMERVWGK